MSPDKEIYQGSSYYAGVESRAYNSNEMLTQLPRCWRGKIIDDRLEDSQVILKQLKWNVPGRIFNT